MSDGRFRYFVLLASMRTGSNLFENNINAYDSLSCHGELFNPQFVGFLNKQPIVDISMTDREKDPVNLVASMIDQVTNSLPGFRLFDDHDPRILDYILADPTCAKIVLSRNPLDSFISLQIASQTDQWKMSDAYKRKKSKVWFEAETFENYLTEKKEFSNHIRMHLQLTGQTAFYLDYADLNDVDVFNGVAKYLGSSEMMVEFPAKTMRQNPEPLSEKVENYDQMMDAIKSIDVFEAPVAPYLEPRQERTNDSFIAATRNPLLYFSMDGLQRDLIIDWMQSHEARPDKIQTELNDRRMERWLGKRSNAMLFTILSDPYARVHSAFEKTILAVSDPDLRRMRRNLNKNYGFGLPDLKPKHTLTRQLLDEFGYSKEDYLTDFDRFLDFLEANLKGQTRAPVHASFATQSALIQGLADWRSPDLIIRPNQIVDGLKYLENQLGLKNKTLQNLQPNQCYPLSDVISDQRSEKIRMLYARDFDQFGL